MRLSKKPVSEGDMSDLERMIWKVEDQTVSPPAKKSRSLKKSEEQEPSPPKKKFDKKALEKLKKQNFLANKKRQLSLNIRTSAIGEYRVLIKDDIGEVLIPNSQGDMFRLLDLCWLVACGKSIKDACISMGLHPLLFMRLRAAHPEIDQALHQAVELSGEIDIEKAGRLMEGLTKDNLAINDMKAKFLIWRGKQRYYRMYGEKPSVNVEVGRTTVTNHYEMSAMIRRLEDNSEDTEIKQIEMEASDYEIKDE